METTHRPARAGHRYWRLLLLATFLAFGGNAAFATADPDSVSFKLEGCKFVNNTNTPLASFNFICSDSAYTTGNLGSGWNELDLVPYRTTAKAGNSAPATQTYAFANALDNMNVGRPGYDIISAPVLNTSLSSASCTAASDGGQQTLTPGVGGIDKTLYRIWTVTQLKNTTCVYDWYGRLAVGSHLWPGSSLHADLLNQSFSTAGIGSKEVSIPVKEILAQSLNKDMSAVENASVTWELTKNGTPANVDFGDVCAADAPTSLPATISVTWTKSAATPSGITVTTHVYATNPAARTVQVTVTDVIYQGTTQTTALDTAVSGLTDLPANSTVLVLTHTALLPAADGNIGDSLNDVATGTYMDPITHVAIPGTTTATAQTVISQGTISNGSAVISDSESITGNGLTFSVATPPSSGSFQNGYAGAATTGPVDWLSSAQTSSGSITFSKTIYVTGLLVTSGVLSDTAHLASASQSLDAPASITTSSTATVKLTVNKTVPPTYFTDVLNGSGDLLKVHFSVTGAGGFSDTFTLTFDSSTPCDVGGCTLSHDLPGLTPDVFTVTETGSEACVGGTCADPPTDSLLAPTFSSTQVDLTPQNGSMVGRCSGSANFVNELTGADVRVNVQKITAPVLDASDPQYMWDFALSGPTTCEPVSAGAGAGFVLFQDSLGGDCLLSDGDYTVTETLKPGWTEDSASPNDGVDFLVCKFHVDVFTDAGTTKSCTFHNTKRAHATLFKTKSGVPDLSSTDNFTFQLRQGADATHVGTILESEVANLADLFQVAFTTDLTPGEHYQFCEIVMPGWLSNIGTIVPNAFMPPDGVPANPNVDNSILCVDFVPGAGEVREFHIDNTPPPGGRALTIGFWKNWSSCSGGRQADTLGATLALPPAGVQVGSFRLTGPCKYVVNLLNKSTMTTGKKMASDPIFNMVAQLIAAELNVKAGAGICPKAALAITQANALLVKYAFNGDTYTPKLTKADATMANNLATELDNYNNDRPSACL
ncbi:MAG TPA: hypothetical protein VFI49_10845 [Rudaea sp.]|nr:hypothetical protein [Rudaea sp.]